MSSAKERADQIQLEKIQLIAQDKSREEKKLKSLKSQAKCVLEKIKATHSTETLVDLRLNILHRKIMKQASRDTPQKKEPSLQSCRNRYFKGFEDNAYFSQIDI